MLTDPDLIDLDPCPSCMCPIGGHDACGCDCSCTVPRANLRGSDHD